MGIERVQGHVSSWDDCIPNHKAKGSDLMYGMIRRKEFEWNFFVPAEKWMEYAGQIVSWEGYEDFWKVWAEKNCGVYLETQREECLIRKDT